MQLNWDDKFVRDLPGDPETRNATRQVFGAAWSAVTPTPVAAPRVLAWSPEVARMVGLRDHDITDPWFAQAFGGNLVLDGMRPYAACYGGHQFGHWAGQLGDGRAITLGEVVEAGQRYELQLKGAGPTPYSRRADGRAVLRSSIREFLCSEAMHHLGVPTTRALSLVTTGDKVVRDMFYDGNAAAEPGAIVCRVAPSFLRFGSFQIHAARQDEDTLRQLMAYTLETHFPALGPLSKESVLAFLEWVARATAVMVAHWMRVGFVHGVMNTDNMSILGLTIDYGPYGWIDAFDTDWTPNTTDEAQGRYRFGYQPAIAEWNLTRFAESLYPLVGDVDALGKALAGFDDAWTEASREMIAGKLGLSEYDPAIDGPLWDDLGENLERVETDMTLFFRALADWSTSADHLPTASAEELLAPVRHALYAPDACSPADVESWGHWFRRYARRLEADGRTADARAAAMNAVNPKYVLRNYLAQEAIELAEKGDAARITELLDVLRTPYDEQPSREHFAAKRPEWARDKPGCSALSCSS